MTLIAIPAAYRDDLAPVLVAFDLDDELGEIRGNEITSARAIVTRPDGIALEWTLSIADEPEATTTQITLFHTLDLADLFDGDRAIAPGLYAIRILVTDADGEHVLPNVWLPVERL